MINGFPAKFPWICNEKIFCNGVVLNKVSAISWKSDQQSREYMRENNASTNHASRLAWQIENRIMDKMKIVRCKKKVFIPCVLKCEFSKELQLKFTWILQQSFRKIDNQHYWVLCKCLRSTTYKLCFNVRKIKKHLQYLTTNFSKVAQKAQNKYYRLHYDWQAFL